MRLREHNYAQSGIYFVTICTANRRHALGKIVEGVMVLSPVGQMVEDAWKRLPQILDSVDLDEFLSLIHL